MGGRILGAVLAGGQARRFGSDKATALWRGRTLLDRAIATLSAVADDVIVCGRPGGLADRPGGGLGPLAGLNAALHEGRRRGHGAVLSLPCDTPVVPPGALHALVACGQPAYLADAPVIGVWPCALADRLDQLLTGPDRSMRAWARAAGAQAIDAGPIANVNTPDDLLRLDQVTGDRSA